MTIILSILCTDGMWSIDYIVSVCVPLTTIVSICVHRQHMCASTFLWVYVCVHRLYCEHMCASTILWAYMYVCIDYIVSICVNQLLWAYVCIDYIVVSICVHREHVCVSTILWAYMYIVSMCVHRLYCCEHMCASWACVCIDYVVSIHVCVHQLHCEHMCASTIVSMCVHQLYYEHTIWICLLVGLQSSTRPASC